MPIMSDNVPIPMRMTDHSFYLLPCVAWKYTVSPVTHMLTYAVH